MNTIVGLLRGINVGGHHKVPMAELKALLLNMGLENVRTILNSGNFLFQTKQKDITVLEKKIETLLLKAFGFSIPVILVEQPQLTELIQQDPFAGVDVHKNIRLYISFLKELPTKIPKLPYCSADQAFTILHVEKKVIVSLVDITSSNTPKGMEDLEKIFGKNITTRNWNTVQKLAI